MGISDVSKDLSRPEDLASEAAGIRLGLGGLLPSRRASRDSSRLHPVHRANVGQRRIRRDLLRVLFTGHRLHHGSGGSGVGGHAANDWYPLVDHLPGCHDWHGHLEVEVCQEAEGLQLRA